MKTYKVDVTVKSGKNLGQLTKLIMEAFGEEEEVVGFEISAEEEEKE